MNPDIPYFHVCRSRDGFVVAGSANASFGHEIARGQGQRADGVFAQWSWNAPRLSIRNDRHGLYPLYYFSGPAQLAVSPSIPKLLELGASPELDDAALAVFFRAGYFIRDETPFAAIRAVPACGLFEWMDGELSIVREQPASRVETGSRDAAIDSYIGLFRQAMTRRRSEERTVGIPLSGGRDSRHILLELCAAGRAPEVCVTANDHGSAASDEAKVAGLLTKAVGVPHVCLPQKGARLDAELRKNRLTNFCADEHAWYLVVSEYLRERVQVVYDGIGGDVLSAGLFLTRELHDLFEQGRYEDVAERLLSATSEHALKKLLAPELYDRVNRELAMNYVAEELASHDQAPNPIGRFFFSNRTRREIALCPYGLLDNSALTVYAPYLDHDLFDFLTSLPASFLWDHDFHTAAIRRAYPAYGSIPYAESTGRRFLGRRYCRAYAWQMLRYLHETRSVTTVSRTYLYPRLLRCMVDRGYSTSVEWLGFPAVYAVQLESAQRTL